VNFTRPHIGFDARERLTGDYDDITVEQAVEAYTQ
jgi:hypothetical protein